MRKSVTISSCCGADSLSIALFLFINYGVDSENGKISRLKDDVEVGS